MVGRRFLIVTAPFGPFGQVLAKRLMARGADVRRMIFNAGDAFYWPGPGREVFKKGVEAWPAAFARMAEDFTDVILFGEGGAYNQAVLAQRRQVGAQIWVLENGYFRPDWITIEKDGVNASSSLPRDRRAYDGRPFEPPVRRNGGRILRHHVAHISIYHTVQFPGRWSYPCYASPYTQPPWLQCLGHIRRYFGLALRPRGEADARLLAGRGPFFLACLQREGDAQLLRYSHFADNTAFMAEVMTSFARGAPADCRLVIKNHPLDPGLVDLARITRVLAIERGLGDRVDFIDGGNLAQLCRASRGMVVNNSSAALSALGFRTPVKVLGDAFYDFDGLTDQQPMDGFWRAPQAPDADLFTRFRAHVLERCQVNGNFHEPDALAPTAEGLADFFVAHPPA